MPILNGFLRGVHDEEITTNIDQKQYAGAPVNMYNWIGTKRGGLSKRAPFNLQQILDTESFIIPYSYDDDEKYLLRFFKNQNNETKYDVYKSTNGKLEKSTFGSTTYVQPTFTSNNSEGHIISSQGFAVDAQYAYESFNPNSLFLPTAKSIGATLTIEFPTPVLLSKMSFVYGFMSSSNTSSGAFKTFEIFIIDENDISIQTDTITNPDIPEKWQQGIKYLTNESRININGLFAKKLKIVLRDYVYNKKGSSAATTVGHIKLTGQIKTDVEEADSPFTYEQIQTANYYNSFRRMFFVHKDVEPREFSTAFEKFEYKGLNFSELGNPTLVRVFQQRLTFAGFTNSQRQINLSKSTEYGNFELNKDDVVPTDPIQGSIDEMKSPLSALFSGRQMLYAQSMDGLGSLNSGADDVPLTATQVSARLRNETPLSKKIQPIRQDEIVYCVGADEKTVYALDYDYQYSRIPLYSLNEHCISYFDSGIKQMVSMYGKLPYIVFLMNDGGLIVAIAYRNNTGFEFHAFPQKIADGEIKNIAVLKNTNTGLDTLYCVVLHSNGQYTIESLESYTEVYSKKTSENYLKNHILLDSKQEIYKTYKSDISFTYTGVIGSNGKRQFTVSSKIEIPDNELLLLINGKEIICKNCIYDENNKLWAETSEEPEQVMSDGYQLPKRTFNMPEYIGLDVQAFDGEDFIEKESEDVFSGTITFKKPIYSAKIGLPYTSYSEFVNITDVNSAQYETIINNISACITYGTGIELGTESTLEKIGYTEYPYRKWQDKILQDESLKNVILNDRGLKNKRVVIKCNFPFPANITFITYDIKATGVK